MPNDFVVVVVGIAADMVAAEAVGIVPSEVVHKAEVSEVNRTWEAASDVDLVDTMVLPRAWPVFGSFAASFVEFVASASPFVVVDMRLQSIWLGTPLCWTS